MNWDQLPNWDQLRQALAALDWGDVAGWLQAIGNLAVFAIALVTLRRDSRRIARLEANAELERKDAAAERVAGVAAWPEKWGDGRIEIRAVNPSVGPVYEVTVRVASTPETLPSFDSTSPGVKRAFLIAPGESLDAVVVAADGSGRAVPCVEIRFRDTSGRTWLRDYTGVLSLVPTSEASLEAT